MTRLFEEELLAAAGVIPQIEIPPIMQEPTIFTLLDEIDERVDRIRTKVQGLLQDRDREEG